MSNPFKARYDSACQQCGEQICTGDDCFHVEGSFVCQGCAEEGDNICECGKFKKDEFDKCYECFIDEKENE